MEATFYTQLKQLELVKKFTFPQVDGFEYIYAAWGQAQSDDQRKLAYILATAWHETAFTMQPIEERSSGKDENKNGLVDYFEKYDTRTDLGNTPALDGDGEKYKGRGFVQLTGKRNYEIFQKILNLPLLNKPELACMPTVAATILVKGMISGIFTGKSLSFYIYGPKCDYLHARRIINGMDKAEQIAKYAELFEKALTPITA